MSGWPKLTTDFHMALARDRSNSWYIFEHAQVYIRVGDIYAARDSRIRCITIANVGMDTKYQRRGCFNRLIAFLHSQASIPIMLENIQDPAWSAHLQTKGWVRMERRLPNDCLILYPEFSALS